MTQSLQDRTVALAEGRQLEELARLLEKEGAAVLRCPLLSILDSADEEGVQSWLRELIAGRFEHVVLLTGEGLRRLLRFAERSGIRQDVIAALGYTRIITRGPKPGQALKEVGLSPFKVAEAPTTEGVIATLKALPLKGGTVGVQLYPDAKPELARYLAEAGAVMVPVLPYEYAPASDTSQVADLIAQLDQGKVDVLVFTSSPQIDRLYEVARERGLEDDLARGMEKTRVAAVGPVVAENLQKRGVKAAICPGQGFVMKNLVKHIKEAFSA